MSVCSAGAAAPSLSPFSLLQGPLQWTASLLAAAEGFDILTLPSSDYTAFNRTMTSRTFPVASRPGRKSSKGWRPIGLAHCKAPEKSLIPWCSSASVDALLVAPHFWVLHCDSFEIWRCCNRTIYYCLLHAPASRLQNFKEQRLELRSFRPRVSAFRPFPGPNSNIAGDPRQFKSR